MSNLTRLFTIGQIVRCRMDKKFYKGIVKETYPDQRVFVADDIWQKWHKGTVKETHEDYILVDVPDICDYMQYENDYIGDVRPEYNFHLDELEG